MIRHVVFDMEQVLVSHMGDLVYQKRIGDEQGREEMSTSVFVSPEWILLDIGVMPEKEALEKIQGRPDTEHKWNMAV